MKDKILERQGFNDQAYSGKVKEGKRVKYLSFISFTLETDFEALT